MHIKNYIMKVLASFSGGKDSHAALIWAKHRFKNVEADFCDTGWEHELTYKHIHEVAKEMNIKLVVLKSKDYNGFLDLALKKKRFPSTKARFCTEKLKSVPMIDYVLEQNEDVLIIQGIRKDESVSRSKMQENCRFFKYYFEPYVSNEIIIENFKNIKVPTPMQRNKYNKAVERLTLGKNDEKYHTYRKDDVLEWCKKYDDSILRPVFNWTGQEVINYIIENGQKPNPLYYMGAGRVGCFPCIMVTHSEFKSFMKFTPEIIKKITDAELAVNSCFFPPNYIPKRYQTGKDEKTGKRYPKAADVINYLTEFTGNLFDNDDSINRSCMSNYGICE